ncbi:MAG: phosphoribosylanthranilate isomerase [Prevotellaceae bacterium]|jgi:phosphoribosylanthranilate isomerase|nr:phosphoribosylanthranilate isomerase [Prevotellaceae bacterium]
MLIKVCGMTRADNIRQVEYLGVDMMGFIFYPKSPRCVREVPGYLPVRARRVGIFVNESEAEMLRIARLFDLDYLQLHGEESPAQCRSLQSAGYQVIKSVTVATAPAYSPVADLLLFDTPTPAYGGSGARFDWSLLPQYRGDTPFLLSGGISPDSVAAIKDFHHPRFVGIDLNSRFEKEPGIKDPDLLRPFLAALTPQCLTDHDKEACPLAL